MTIRQVPRKHEIQEGVIVTTVDRKAVPHVMRADVLKIMRRVRQRIADRRWSGVPT